MDFSQFFDYDGQTVKRSESDFVFLADLPADDWQHILDVTQRYGFAAGDVVIRQGEVSSALYIVASGELDVILIGDNGTTRPISRIDPLSVFGEQAFFDGLPRYGPGAHGQRITHVNARGVRCIGRALS
jgi:hypothetical protein